MTRFAYALVALLLFQGASGVGGGLALTLDATGTGIGLDPAWIAGSPFTDYRIPGLFLLLVLGVGPLVATALVLRRSPWAWSASLMVGLTLLAWLLVEVAVIGWQPDPPLQLIYGIVGGAIVFLTLHPTVRRELREVS